MKKICKSHFFDVYLYCEIKRIRIVMPTKAEYLIAKQIVIQYELLTSNYQKQLQEVKEKYPIGTFIISKLNTVVRGKVVGYQQYNGKVKIIIEKNNGKKSSVMFNNAEQLF